jgi:hypothetical protein
MRNIRYPQKHRRGVGRVTPFSLAWARISELLRSQGIDSKEWIPHVYVACVGNFRTAMGARNQAGIGLSYRPASLCSLATQFQTRFLESIPCPIPGLKFSTLSRIWNLLRSPGIDSQPSGIDSLESIPRLLKRLEIQALAGRYNK